MFDLRVMIFGDAEWGKCGKEVRHIDDHNYNCINKKAAFEIGKDCGRTYVF